MSDPIDDAMALIAIGSRNLFRAVQAENRCVDTVCADYNNENCECSREFRHLQYAATLGTRLRDGSRSTPSPNALPQPLEDVG